MPKSTSPRNTYDFTIKEMQHVNNLLHKDFPERIRKIVEILYMQLLESERPTQCERMAELAQVAVEQMERLSSTLGGTLFYLPKCIQFSLINRDKQIMEEYKGFNTRDLAIKYGLSEERIRQIIKSEEKKKRRKERFGSTK